MKTVSSGSYERAYSRRLSLPPRDWRVRIEDILESLSKIERYTRGMTVEEFRTDDKTVDAVVRNLGIIGAAARRLATCHPTYRISILDYPGARCAACATWSYTSTQASAPG